MRKNIRRREIYWWRCLLSSKCYLRRQRKYQISLIVNIYNSRQKGRFHQLLLKTKWNIIIIIYMAKANCFSFERRLRNSNFRWQNQHQHQHEILSQGAGTDPTRAPAYWKSKSPFSQGILNFLNKVYKYLKLIFL